VNEEIVGNTAMTDRDWDTAAAAYKNALRKNPQNLMAQLGLADIAHARGAFDDAFAILHDALQDAKAIAPAAAPAIHERLGQLYADAGDYDRSIAQFFLAQEDAPDVARFHVAMADACLNAGRDECAAEQYALAVETQHLPDDVSRTIALADLWRQRNYNDRALTLYEDAVAAQPILDNQLMLVSVYQEMGLFDKAEALLKEMRRQHPVSTEVLTVAGGLFATQGKYDEAIDEYRRAVRLETLESKETIEARLPLARTLLDANRLKDAVQEIQTILALDPNNAAGYALLGDFYQKQRRFDKAIDAYQRAFRLDPTQVGLFLRLSDQLQQQGRQQGEILDLLQTAIQANPDEATLALALGDNYQRHGDIAEATEAYKSALDMFESQSLSATLDPRSARLSQAYAYTRLANIQEDQGNLEPAMNYYSAAVAAAPDATWTQITLGDALHRRGEMDQAQIVYQRAIQADPTEVDAYVRLADLAAAQGAIGQAARLRQQAQKIALAQASLETPPVASTGANVGPTVGATAPQDEITANAAFKSDETVETTDPSAADQATTGITGSAPRTANREIGGNTLGLLARIYQENGQTDEAIQLYQDKLKEGEEKGWYPAVLAQYQKGLGDLYLAAGHPGKAKDAYTRAVTLDAWWPQARLGLARALSDLGDKAGALKQLEEAVAVAPGLVEAQIALADAFAQQGMSAVALAIYKATAEAHPGNERAVLALARAWRQRGQWETAEASYRSMIDLNPGSSEAYVGLASLLMDSGRYNEARALLQQALGIDQQSVNAHLQLGVLEQRLGNQKAAVDQYQLATNIGGESVSVILIDQLNRYADYGAALAQIESDLTLTPDDPELLLRMAGLQRTLGRYPEAMAALRRAEKLGLDDSRFSVELGEILRSQGRPHAALAAYRQTVNKAPDEPTNYLTLSELWGSQGDYDRAVATLKDGIGKVTQAAPLYAALASLQLQRGDAEAARATLDTALQTYGEDESLVLAMGAYLQSEDEKKVEAWYNDALAREPDNAVFHLALGNEQFRNGDKEAGLAHLEQAVALDPANGGYLLELGDAYRDLKRTEDAESAYVQALALDPTLENAYVNLGELYRKQKRADDARAIYEQGLKALPTSGALLVGYGQFLSEQGDDAGALAALEQISQLSPTAESLMLRAAAYLDMDDALFEGATDGAGTPEGEDAENAPSPSQAYALRDLEEAQKQEPGSVAVLVALGDLYRLMGDQAEARQVYTEADELLPGIDVASRRLAGLQRR